MPDITVQEITGWLQKASLSYKNAAFVADEVFPLMPMKATSAKFWTKNVGDVFRLDSTGLLAKGAEAHEIEQKGAGQTVTTDQYGWKTAVYDEDVEALGYNAGSVPPVQLRQEAIETNAYKLGLLREKRVADLVIARSWSEQTAAGEDAEGLWGELGSTNTFYTDTTARIGTLSGAGVPQDMMQLMMDDQTFRALIQSDDVRDRIKYTQGITDSLATPSQLAQSIGLTNPIVVGGSLYNSEIEENDATDNTKARIWEVNSGKGMAFLYAKPKRVGFNMVAAGVQPLTQINGQNRQNVTYRIPENRKTMYESREKLGAFSLLDMAGWMWKDTFAT